MKSLSLVDGKSLYDYEHATNWQGWMLRLQLRLSVMCRPSVQSSGHIATHIESAISQGFKATLAASDTAKQTWPKDHTRRDARVAGMG
jgi:hypothetical protein